MSVIMRKIIGHPTPSIGGHPSGSHHQHHHNNNNECEKRMHELMRAPPTTTTPNPSYSKFKPQPPPKPPVSSGTPPTPMQCAAGRLLNQSGSSNMAIQKHVPTHVAARASPAQQTFVNRILNKSPSPPTTKSQVDNNQSNSNSSLHMATFSTTHNSHSTTTNATSRSSTSVTPCQRSGSIKSSPTSHDSGTSMRTTPTSSGSPDHVTHHHPHDEDLPAEPPKVCPRNKTLLQHIRQTSNTAKEPINYFELLKDETLVKIFSNLSAPELCASTARVCRRWYYLTWDPSLWKRIIFRPTYFPPQVRSHPDSGGSESHYYSEPTSDYGASSSSATNGSSPRITGTIRKHGGQLHLNVDRGVRMIIKILSRDSYCRERTTTIQQLSLSSTSTTRSLSSVSSSGDSNTQSISYASLLLPIESVSFCSSLTLTDSSLTLLAAKAGSSLKELQVKGCSFVGDTGVWDILTGCPNLERLSLPGCTGITLNPPGNHSGNSSHRSSPMSGYMSKLSLVDLTDCVRVDDAGLKAFLQQYGGPNLAKLFLRRCIKLTDRSAKSIAVNCPALSELSLYECPALGTNASLTELMSRGLGVSLRYISLAHCDSITDYGLNQVAQFAYKLRYLNVRGCSQLTDQGIVAVARSCGNRLRALDIGRCDISDEGLKCIGGYCSNLRKLSLAGCELVTDRGLESIARSCTRIHAINVTDCDSDQVTNELLQLITKLRPSCVIGYNGEEEFNQSHIPALDQTADQHLQHPLLQSRTGPRTTPAASYV